jgi:hypothetical protein
MEPLLRWLNHGGRGYAFGCLSSEENDKHRMSTGAYADDLAVLTNTMTQMRAQADKIARYAKWGGLKVNTDKCVLTGELRHSLSCCTIVLAT